jgi:hypothetical protein
MNAMIAWRNLPLWVRVILAPFLIASSITLGVYAIWMISIMFIGAVFTVQQSYHGIRRAFTSTKPAKIREIGLHRKEGN